RTPRKSGCATFLWANPTKSGWTQDFQERVDLLAERGRLCPEPLRVSAREGRRWTTDLPALLALARRAMLHFPCPDPNDPLTRLGELWRASSRTEPSMRCDAILSADGLKICELNMTPGNGGIWQ